MLPLLRPRSDMRVALRPAGLRRRAPRPLASPRSAPLLVTLVSVLALVPSLTLLPVSALASSAPGEPITLHVSPEGNDAWTGSAPTPNAARTDGPLASLEGARDRLRALRREAGGKLGPATVSVRGGAYRLERPFVLEPEDSGTPEAPVLYASGDGERAVLSGGRVIEGLRPKGALWECEIPAVKAGRWYFRQLFVNGTRRRPARLPNEGYFRIAGLLPGPRDARGAEIARDRFRFRPGDLEAWPRLADARIVLMHSWETSIHPVKSIDPAAQVVELTAPLKEWWTIGYWEKAQRYYVEGILEALDAPGEWHLDRETGVLSYYPLPGETIEDAEVVAPALGELVRFAGDAEGGRLVEHVTLRGLAFHHADWELAPGGNSSTQAAVEVPAAVMADGAASCALERSEVAHVGTYGVWLRRGCKGCRVEGNRLFDLGAGGVRVGEDRMAATNAVESSRNVVDSNHIYDGGHVYAAGVGIWVAQSSHNVISHNEVHDLLYSGISVGWNWNDASNRCHHNTIEENHVHHLVHGVLSDAGAIYCLGASPGSVIRRNVFHDVWPYETPPFGWGIYLDATTSGYLVEENIVYHTKSGGLMFSNGGHENVIRNNVFALNADYTIWPFFEKRSNRLERNIFFLTQGDLLVPLGERSLQDRLAAGDPLGVWDENVYWHAGGPERLRFFRRTFEEWRVLGLDRRSRVADPLFVDVDACDFRLRPGSPALELGFRPIDASGAGLRGDPKWVEEGRAVSHPKTILPPPPQPPAPREVDEGFEDTAPGSPPPEAHVSGERNGASIRVTEEKAASGRQSLEVRDSRTLEPAWEPHFYYEPHLSEGRVRQRFEVWLGPDARFFAEWRDAGPYPGNVGPSVTFDEAGAVIVGGKAVGRIPQAEWVRVEIEAGLGKGASRDFRLTLTPRGKESVELTELPMVGASFRELHWLGFSSTAASDSAFWLDDLELKRVGD